MAVWLIFDAFVPAGEWDQHEAEDSVCDQEWKLMASLRQNLLLLLLSQMVLLLHLFFFPY